ncbi:E3 ubiquitin-protein ligase mib1, partial [Fasciola gigantica]
LFVNFEWAKFKCYAHSFHILQAILRHCLCQTPWLVDEPQPDGLTALHLASLHGHLEVTDLLLQAGADPNLTVQRPAGLTGPPVRGVESGPGGTSASSVSVLLTQSNFTALHLAVHKAHPDVVCLLLCYGARATTTRNTDGRSPMQLVLTTLAQTHDMQQHSGQSTRRFDVALVPFLASVARLLVRMADSLTVTSSSPGPAARQSRRRSNREEFEEQLISIDDPSEDEDANPESLNDAACLTVPSPLCRRLKSTIQATLETGVPRLVLIAACLASAIGAESWSASCATEDDEPDTRNTESITEAFVADIFGEYLDPVLQLALQQCHMEAMNSMSQVRVSNTENETRSPRHHGVSGGAQPRTELLVDMDEIEEENLVDALLQADSLSEPAISLLPVGIVTVTENNAVEASGSCTGSENREGTGDIPEATNDIIFVPTPDGHATNVLHQPLTIANQLVPRLNNLCVHDPTPRSESHLLPPALEEMDLEWRECLVCSEANRATVIIPCGHIITCRQCTSLIKKCLLCRMRITGFHEFTQCCECQQSTGVIIARPCNHMLWCKLCLKTKSNQLDIIDRICPTEQFDLTTHSSLILQTDQHQIDQSKRLSPKPSASSSSSSTLASSAVATVGAATYQIGSTSMAAVDENGPGGAAGRSVSGVLPIAGVQQQKSILSDSFNQPQQQLNSTIQSMGIGTNEWHEVPLARLLVMIGKVNSLLDDLMTGGLCIDGCPVCTQPIEALLPIIVACAGVEQQASFSRELELPSEVLAETNPPSNNNLSTSFGLPQTTNNRTAEVFVRGPPESDILPTTSSSIVARAERGTLDLHTVPNRTAVTPNNRLHQSTSRSDSTTLRKRNQRPQLCERELSKLKHELQVMREQIRCPICLDRSRNLVFMCGHATCQWCGDQVTACPICRRAVESRIILY